MSRRTHKTSLPRCVLDSGGLSSLTGRGHEARYRLRFLAAYRGALQIPAAILVESTTGDPARDAEVNHVLDALLGVATLSPIDEPTARRAGQLRYRAKTDDGIDAIVASIAVGDGSPAVVLTSDPRDLKRLLARHPHVEVRAV